MAMNAQCRKPIRLSHGAVALCAAGVLLAASQAALAQSYPVKPVRIVTTAPGSANDIVARMIAFRGHWGTR
jgi:tripartite-type tricarboxylate transporter receptor subunit TctC